ncbi:hypothetical protein F0U60_09580 [Archangium minus]|uniref:BNR repeat domain protein n=1 Tax=Archangium minus TaxID=83450 RepID=A0ABY9WRH6_9BACT|nr:hypothetical protein F0U60_09580 [Archangium minus]
MQIYTQDQSPLTQGRTASIKVTVRRPGLTGVTALALGMRHVLTLDSDGTVWAWGRSAGPCAPAGARTAWPGALTSLFLEV